MILRFKAAWLLWMVVVTACSTINAAPEATLSPLEIRGRGVFDAVCSRCHGRSGDTVVVGPSLAGVATRAGSRIEGMDAETYIRDSIQNPGAYTVEGFPEGVMPEMLKDELTPEQFDAVVAFLLTLD
jgi:mono/diheme cytochrome c family protein